jgi:UPF0755 protein
LDRAEAKRILRSAKAVRILNKISQQEGAIRSGTFELSPTMEGSKLLGVLLRGEPVRQSVLIREGLNLVETARILERKRVADKKTFMGLCKNPKELNDLPPFIIPTKGLEGYLFPDTHNFPPLLGAEDSIRAFLSVFNKKVYEPLHRPKPGKLRAWVIIGSMIELEVKKPNERARVAGVIYNRLNKGMPLQIDATVAYALAKKGRLKYVDYTVNSPYNTYKIKTLPPGPICSPGKASIIAAAHPEKHHLLYYVAMPDGSHKFAATYEEHLANIAVSRKAFAASQKQKSYAS